jgi:uncharacterized protein YdeI (YjbR/CyaY-like superfamily)
MATRDPRVDAYIANAAPFAQPILVHLRKVVHEACPDVTETVKWGMPFFDYEGPLANMAAFKKHVAFGFWKAKLLSEHLPAGKETAMGQFGRVAAISDLPSKRALAKIVKAAARLDDEGVKIERTRKPKPALRTPASLLAALKKSPKALAAFEALPPSHKREYAEWISEAKREGTRARRIATALEWISKGRSMNWKYER